MPKECADESLGCEKLVWSVWDPDTDALSPVEGLGVGFGDVVITAHHVIQRPMTGRTLRVLSGDLRTTTKLTLPAYDGKHPDQFHRSYGDVEEVNGNIFVGFNDNDQEDASEAQGFLLHREGKWRKVLVGERLDKLVMSSDGSALLGVRRPSGEPCGGCDVKREIVEVDPATGKLVGDYNAPPGADKRWHYGRVDKVDGVIAVRVDTGPKRGLWTYDGTWKHSSKNGAFGIWWQGQEDQLRVDTTAKGNSGLRWHHGGTDTLLAESPGGFGSSPYELFVVPGSLLPVP